MKSSSAFRKLTAAGTFGALLGLAVIAAPSAKAFSVAIVPTSDGGFPGNMQSELEGTGLFSTVDVLTTLETPAQLASYNAVLFYNNSAGDFSDWGNNLATYTDDGGHVVLATFLWQSTYGYSGSMGALISSQYNPFSGYLGNYVSGSLGTVEDPTSPIIDGPAGDVTSVSSYYRDLTTLNSNATLVASWSDGTPLVAVAPSGDIGITMFPDDGYGGAGGDYVALFANALLDTSSPVQSAPDTASTLGLFGLGAIALMGVRRLGRRSVRGC